MGRVLIVCPSHVGIDSLKQNKPKESWDLLWYIADFICNQDKEWMYRQLSLITLFYICPIIVYTSLFMQNALSSMKVLIV